ncbi:MAG: hypothetical protein AAGD35_04275 [Actinomycetota bacterium]
MDKPPIRWWSTLSSTPPDAEDDAVAAVRAAALDLRDNGLDQQPKRLFREAERHLMDIDLLLRTPPSPSDRLHLLRSAELLLRIGAHAHQRAGRQHKADHLREASGQIRRTWRFTPLDDTI